MLLLRDPLGTYRCGELDGGVEGDYAWFTCTCGARIVRRDSAAAATR
jgi:hypothetical protein